MPPPPPNAPGTTPPAVTPEAGVISSPFATKAGPPASAELPSSTRPRPAPPPSTSSAARAHSAQLSGLRGLVAICGDGNSGDVAAPAPAADGPRVEIVGAAHPSVAVRRLARSVIRGLRACQEPIALPEGLGGTYVFSDEAGRPAALIKPVDEEPLGPANGKGWSGRELGAPGLKPTVRVGEAAMREVAAYLLDHGGFAKVPPTVLVRARHPVFHVAGRPANPAVHAGPTGVSARPAALASVASDAASALPGGGGGGGALSQANRPSSTIAGFGPPPASSRRPASALPTARSGSLPDPSSPVRSAAGARGGPPPPRSPARPGGPGGLSAALGRARTGSGELSASGRGATPPPSATAATPQPLPLKLASMAKYIAHDGDASEYGASRFSLRDVHAVGILDIRLCQTDRHAMNLLVRKPVGDGGGGGRARGSDGGGGVLRPSAEGGATPAVRAPALRTPPPTAALPPSSTGPAPPWELVPIDHGYCLPEAVEPLFLEWLHWPAAARPFSEEALAYIAALDADADAALLRRELPSLHTACLRVLWIGTTLLQRCAAAGLTLAEIGTVASRPLIGLEEEASELERLCWSAREAALGGGGSGGGSAASDDGGSPAPPPPTATPQHHHLLRRAPGGSGEHGLLVFQLDALELGASPDPSPPGRLGGGGGGMAGAPARPSPPSSSSAGEPAPLLAMAVSAPTPARAAAAAAVVAAAQAPSLGPPPLPPPAAVPRPRRRSRRDLGGGPAPAPYPPPPTTAPAGAAVPVADLTPAQWAAFQDAFERGVAAALADGRWRAASQADAFGQSCAF